MHPVQQARWRHRLVRHHAPLLLLSVLAVAALYVTRPYRDPVTRLSFATAYPALLLMAVTLVTGPWNVLRARRNPVSSDLRRDLGIWAGLLAVIHAAVGQNVHLRGRPWLYYVYEHRAGHMLPLRHDLFGVSNETGALSTLVVLALLATSNDYALRRLGTPRWKKLQRWNYAAFALAAAHTFGYQWNEAHNTGFKLFTAVCAVLTLTLQITAFQHRRGDSLRRTRSA